MPETVESGSGTPVAAARKVKLPRGFARTKARLDRAVKEGASLTGLLGKQAHIGGRIRKGEGVRRSSLKKVEKALDQWEAKKPVRLRAAKRAMRPRKPSTSVAKAAGSVRAVATLDVKWMVKMYLDATPDERSRFRAVIEALGSF